MRKKKRAKEARKQRERRSEFESVRLGRSNSLLYDYIYSTLFPPFFCRRSMLRRKENGELNWPIRLANDVIL